MLILEDHNQVLFLEHYYGQNENERKEELSTLTLHIETDSFPDNMKLVEVFENQQDIRFAVQKNGSNYSLYVFSENGKKVKVPPNSVWTGEFMGASIQERIHKFMQSEGISELILCGKYVTASLVLSFQLLDSYSDA